MAISSYPPAVPKRTVVTLTSGTSYTVPTGVTYLNVILQGGGGSGALGNSTAYTLNYAGYPGKRISSTLTVTPGASIAYAIGAGGAAVSAAVGPGNAGGTTTFTGATSATGGNGGRETTFATDGTSAAGFDNSGKGSIANATGTSGAGGSGLIEIEYWA